MENTYKENHTKTAVASGPLKILNIEIDCYVLEDGTPIMSSGKITRVIGKQWRGLSRSEYPIFLGAKNLMPFVTDELKNMLIPIIIKDGNKHIRGYNAEILPLVADVYLKARDAGVLLESQQDIAKRCEIIVRSFARIGVRALVYEATGFEKLKHPEALRMLIESYLTKEERKWMKEFPDEFFGEMDRIYGNLRTSSRGRPPYYGKFIRKYIYDPIEHGIILKELDKRNPVLDGGYRKSRFHQFLNENKGIQVLRSQIWQVLALLRVSPSKRRFESNYERLTSKQMWLFDVDEE